MLGEIILCAGIRVQRGLGVLETEPEINRREEGMT